MSYFRTTLVVEVLGNEPFTGDITDLSAAVFGGDFSGTVLSECTMELDADQASALLEMQGSDPGFLGVGTD